MATDLSFLTGGPAERLEAKNADGSYSYAIQPGNVYFTTDGKIYFDLNSTTRLQMGKIANSAFTADAFTSPRAIELEGEVTGSIESDGLNGWTIPTTVERGIFVPIDGSEAMTGALSLVADAKDDTLEGGALNVKGSNINKVNALFFNACDTTAPSKQGIQFARSDNNNMDVVYAEKGALYFAPNRVLGKTSTGHKILTSSNYNEYAVTKTGSNATGDGWGIGITGNAATATALTSSDGDAKHPIYFSSGKPVQCTDVIANSISGNSATTTKLKTSVKINGTDFDGSDDITTMYWGPQTSFNISDGTNTGDSVVSSGGGTVTIQLPNTIKANLTGTADKAKALDVSGAIGNESKPVYIDSNGTPKECTSIDLNISTANNANALTNDIQLSICGNVQNVNGGKNGTWTAKDLTNYDSADALVPAVSGKIPSTYLPSYVDDVIEGYYINNNFYTANSATSTQMAGMPGIIYVDLNSNNTYRYSGSQYIQISNPISIGTTTGTAFDGGTGYQHTINHNNPHQVTSEQINALSTIETLNQEVAGPVTFKGTISANSGIQGNLTGNVTGNLTGNVTGNLTGDVIGNLTGNVTGNADTASKLAIGRSINGTIFNGTQDITTNSWGTSRNITIGDTQKSINGSQDYSWDSSAIGYRHEWEAKVICSTWSRLCYVSAATGVIGSKFILNIGATRGNVVYNDTFIITAHHSSNGKIIKIAGNNYSSGHQLRLVVNSNGDCYIELYDNCYNATASTIQTVYCRLIPIYCGAITKYTTQIPGTTLPSGYRVQQTMVITTEDMQGHVSYASSASQAAKLSAGRNLQVDLTADGSVVFDGSTDVSIGVTGILDMANGGTGNDTFTANRLVWTTSDGTVTKMVADNHFVSANKLGVNSTSEPGYNFYVNGTSGFNNLVTVSTGDSKGIKLGSAYITAESTTNGEVVLQGGHLRFGPAGWDYNLWGGLACDGAKTIALGLADRVANTGFFQANSVQTGGTLTLPGIHYLVFNGKKAISAGDSWLRINQDSSFSDGIYCGTSIVRTDEQFQVGSQGQFFYANKQGKGFFRNTLRIGETGANTFDGSWCEGIRINAPANYWVTIALGAVSESGTNTNMWSLHRTSTNQFNISRGSSDGINGLVLVTNDDATNPRMGLGTGSPSHRLHVIGDIKTEGTLYLERNKGGNAGRINFYKDTYKNWVEYMSDRSTGLCPTGGTPASLGNVTSWARRSIIEDIAGYGWVWESSPVTTTAATSGTTATGRMSLSSNDGTLTVTGPIKRGSLPGTWVAGCNGGAVINSTMDPGTFSPMMSGGTTNGRMVLAFYTNGLQATYITRANCNSNINNVGATAMLMDESGGARWPGLLTQGNPSGDSTIINMNRFETDLFVSGNGAAPNSPKVAGFYLGKSTSDGNRHMDIVSGADYSYIDFNKASDVKDYQVRLIANVSTGLTQFTWGGGSDKRLDIAGNLSAAGNLNVGGTIVSPNALFTQVGNNYGYIAYPGGGHSLNNGGTITGYLTIALPSAAWLQTTMLKFKVSIFDYTTHRSVDYIISVYTYNSGDYLYNPTAICLGRGETYLSNLPVRFGYQNNRYYIYIGESNTSWSYPNVNISDVTIGHNASADTYNKWKDGWSVYFGTSLASTIKHTITNTHVAKNSNVQGLAITGYGDNNLTYYQTPNSFFGSPQGEWASYIICNHGNGSNYYNQTIRMPFGGVPQYKRLVANSGQGWYDFITDENYAGKLDGRYVNVTGDSMTGTLSWGGNISSLNLRTGHASYDGVISYQTAGNEAMLFTTKNAVTSFMFVNGEDTITNMSSERWKSLTPGLQIKNNCVSIGRRINDGATPAYKLDVNGTARFSGQIDMDAGMRWKAPGNIICVADGGSAECSFDVAAGVQWHVWSSANGTSMLSCFASSNYVQVHHHLQVGNYSNGSYTLTTDSFICNSWIRTMGKTGWYNEEYGGGWFMEDTTYVRAYNNKAVYVSNGGDHAIYTAGGFATARQNASLFSSYYNGTWYTDTIWHHGNGNLSIDAPGGSLYLAYWRGEAFFCGGIYKIDRAGYFNGSCALSNRTNMVMGSYTANGGQQNPNYFGKNRVGFLMMNTTVNGNSQYKDWLIMDCYSGNDVGGGVAFGVNRQSLGAYIMRSDAARTSWAQSAELLHTANYTTYCAAKSHTHSYLPLSGGSLTGSVYVTGASGNWNEKQMGVYWGSSSNAGLIYFWGNTSSGTRGIYDTTVGYIAQIPSGSTTPFLHGTLIAKSGTSYGALPSSGSYAGQIFFAT